MAEAMDDCQEGSPTASQNAQDLIQTKSDDTLDIHKVMNEIISQMFDNPYEVIKKGKIRANVDLDKILIKCSYLCTTLSKRQCIEKIREDILQMEWQCHPEFDELRINICNACTEVLSEYQKYYKECDRETLRLKITGRLVETVIVIYQNLRNLYRKSSIAFEDYKAPKGIKRKKNRSLQQKMTL